VRRRPWKRYAATTAIIVGGLYTGYHYDYSGENPSPPVVGAVTANVWVATTGDTTCPRSSSLVTYEAALAAGAVCNLPQLACAAATGGDTVGMRPGTYEPSIQRWITSDCSDGAGNAVDWNTSTYADLSRATNWVTFKCEGERNAVKSSLGGFTIKANAHVIFDGGPDKCFYFRGSVYFGESGDGVRTTQNAVLYRTHLYGVRMHSVVNAMVLDSEIGPSMKCGKVGAFVDDRIECDPNAGYWESDYANYGTATSGCSVRGSSAGLTLCGGTSGLVAMEPIVGIATSGLANTGARMEGNWIHDQQTKDSVKWHPGCLLYYSVPNGTAANSFVFTRNTCERYAVQGVQMGEHGDGATITNNVFGTPLYGCDTSPGGGCVEETILQHTIKMKTKYAGCGGFCYWSPQNVTVAYNTMVGGGHVPWTTSTDPITFTNVRFIGNLSLTGQSSVCSATGASGGSVTYAGNYGPGCTAISGGTANVVSASQGSSLGETRVMDLHLTGATKTWEAVVEATLGGLDDNVDVDGDARDNQRTAGADER
jgi:hypothetical protein